MGNLNSDYANHMKHHPYGYGLFHTVSNGILKPGSVGYLDELGFWNPIANLEDPESPCKAFTDQRMDSEAIFASQRGLLWLYRRYELGNILSH